MALIERRALCWIEIPVMPDLIGGGRPFCPPAAVPAKPRLRSVRICGRGCACSVPLFGIDPGVL